MKYILCLAYLVLSLSTFAQISTNYVPVADISTFDWVTYLDNQECRIEYKRTDCNENSGLDQQYIFLRFTNKTQNQLNLNWEMDLFYNGGCKTCSVDEYQWQYILEPSESVEGECAIGAENKLRLFSKFIDANYSNNSELTGFKFSNLYID